MSRICEVCGKKPVAGRTYARRGLAKSKGGVGRKITGVTKRRFSPNIQIVRIVDEKGTVRRSRVCVKCLRTGLRKGTIRKAISRSRAPKEVAEPTSVTPAVREEHPEGRGADVAEESGTESEARAGTPEAAEAKELIEAAETTEDRESEAEATDATGEDGLGADSLDNLDIRDDGPHDE